MEQSQENTDLTQGSPSCETKMRYVSERTLALSVIISLLAGAALVYIWYEPFVYGSKRILNGRIYGLEAQRDQVLQQRKVLKKELDICEKELGPSPDKEIEEGEEDVG